MTPERIQNLLAILPVIFFAITVHEFAHAFVAYRAGDPTPKEQGRLTLNPVAHFDPLGVMFILFTSLTGFGFGWGKPVEIVPRNFRNPRWDELKVAAAGPASNILQAVVFAILSVVVLFLQLAFDWADPNTILFLKKVTLLGVTINLALAFFNLVPLFPLDGEKILVQSLPLMAAVRVREFRQYGMPLFFGLLFMGQLTGGLIAPLHWWIRGFMFPFLWVYEQFYQLAFQVIISYLH